MLPGRWEGRSRNDLLEYIMVALHSPVVIDSAIWLDQSPLNGNAEAVAACRNDLNSHGHCETRHLHLGLSSMSV